MAQEGSPGDAEDSQETAFSLLEALEGAQRGTSWAVSRLSRAYSLAAHSHHVSALYDRLYQAKQAVEAVMSSGRSFSAAGRSEVSLFDHCFHLAPSHQQEIDEETGNSSAKATSVSVSEDVVSSSLVSTAEATESAKDEGVIVTGKDLKAEESRFRRKFSDIIWCTYRRNFEAMKPPSSFTSDAGWGCMLRTAQMLLAEVLVRHRSQDDETVRSRKERSQALLLRWFMDVPTYFAFYSIHRMTECGRQYGKQPGEWYGPNTVAFVLRDLVASHSEREMKENASDSDNLKTKTNGQSLKVLLCDDGCIYVEELYPLATGKSREEVEAAGETAGEDPMLNPRSDLKWTSALFILIPVRLGLHTLNEEYVKPILEILRFPQSVGMIGGRPSHSLYFVGSSDEDLVYLDPHTVQDAVYKDQLADKNFPTEELVATYHCGTPRLIPIRSIDPSFAVGFYVDSEKSFLNLGSSLSKLDNSFITVAQKRPEYVDFAQSVGNDEDEGWQTASDGEKGEENTDDFVLM